MMQVVSFLLKGRVGHFMRAEMNASALSYPIPPRTSLLGLLGAILGVPKDESTVRLSDALIGIGGAVPDRHYHTANIRKRKGLPDLLPPLLKQPKAGQGLPDVQGQGEASQVTQEWLLQPAFQVYAASPENRGWFRDLEERVMGESIRTHFTPCLGLAWMLAELDQGISAQAEPLPEGRYEVVTVCRKSEVQLPAWKELQGREIQEIRMPRNVTAERVFQHENYYLEMKGQPIPVQTTSAWCLSEAPILFL